MMPSVWEKASIGCSMQAFRSQRRRVSVANCNARFAIEPRRPCCTYQPIICLQTGTTVAREALLRWRHPLRGLVPPSDFIALLEESERMIPLGEWVIRRACRDAAAWPDKARVAVNVSPKQLGGRGLPEAIASALAESGLPGTRLEIEVTETIALDPGGMMLATFTLSVRLA